MHQESPLLLSELTFEAARAYLEADDRLLLPFGSVEQNGAHLPLGTDTIVAEAIAREVSKRSGVLVGPGIPWGNASADAGYPGTISLPANLLNDLVTSVCASLGSHGFRRIMIVTGHLSNVWNVALVAGDLRDRGILVGQVDVWRLMERLCADLTQAPDVAFWHGSEMCTSVIMALAPHLVDSQRMEKVVPEPGWAWDTFASYPAVMGFSRWEEISPIGTTGDPTGASAKAGEQAIDRIATHIAELLDSMRTASLPEQ